MAAPPYMKLYVADYLADTTHLTRGEHGAYLLLLMAMWRAGGKLPANDLKLAQIAKCSAREWADVRQTVLEFFTRRGGQLSHKRLAAEMAKAESISSVRKGASDKAVSEKRRKNSAKPAPNGAPNGDQLVPYIRHQISEERPPNPPMGGGERCAHFEEAWKAYPEAGRGNHGPAAAWAEWNPAAERAGGEAALAAAVERRAGWLREHPKERVKAFHRWLRDDGFASYLAAAPEERCWAGPPWLWDAVVAERSEDFARSWISPCRWQDLPRALVTSSNTVASRLRQEIGPLLREKDIEVLEKAA